MESNRDKIFEYIYAKADEVGYMELDAAQSNKFQDSLQKDVNLRKLAGNELSRNYIKDTVLNNYSKKQRYISAEDVSAVLDGISQSNVIGTKKELENGVFKIEVQGSEFRCTSSSFGEWQTVLKRFGKINKAEKCFAFLTCGGVQQSEEGINSVKDILSSYGVDALIVKPHQSPISLDQFVERNRVIGDGDSIKLPKPFILLAGISGTGKSRFVRQQAESHGVGNKNFCLVPVRPDWHEPSDLLGYISRIGGKPEYVSTKVLQFIIDAWKAVAPNADSTGLGELDLDSPPYWLCLDEMNLAPVEQYFADYLSAVSYTHLTLPTICSV